MIIRRLIYGILMSASAASALSVPAYAAEAAGYRLDLTRGRFPEGVAAVNANGVEPLLDGYKRGYTLDGWMVDRLYDRGYVAVSPTYVGEGNRCENILSLPAMRFSGGEWLRWDALSLYRHFPESYRVEAVPADGGDPLTLAEIDGEDYAWHSHTLPLGRLSGEEMTIRFVATSESGYMLALSDISVSEGYLSYIGLKDLTPAFQGENEYPQVRFSLTCTGTDVKLAGISCRFTGAEGDSGMEKIVTISEPFWLRSGESRLFSVDLPGEVFPDVRYEISVIDAEEPRVSGGGFGSGSTYVGLFGQRLVVDRGTGIWCVNCPEGEIAADALRAEFGDGLIMLNTHVNDCLANPGYWENLGWYSVPRMMLGRDNTTEGGDAGKFAGHYLRQPQFGIRLDKVESPQSAGLNFTAHVSAASPVDNAGGRYRVGYVVTGDFHDPGNSGFVQKNNCSQPRHGAFYFLPSAIPPALMYYDDVTLTSEGAFGGVEGSLPDRMEPDEEYAFTASAALPQLADPEAIKPEENSLRVVAFVIDTETGLIENASALRVGEDPFAGVESIPGQKPEICCLRVDRGGNAIVILPEGNEYRLEIFSAGGMRLRLIGGISAGHDLIPLDLDPGVYLLRLISDHTGKSVKAIIEH